MYVNISYLLWSLVTQECEGEQGQRSEPSECATVRPWGWGRRTHVSEL